jgi:MFS transporter, MFS domain-containing protein family, molybdate-anion transporter
MNFYFVIFAVTLTVSIILTYFNFNFGKIENIEQQKFQKNYLIVYTLAYFADWLKGPYVYALYESHGMTEHEIAMLFVVGFGVSGLCGPVVGGLADKYGRKKLSVAYFVIYILSALCKPFPNFNILLLGRLLSGIGTSLLTTTFESWMVSEHNRRQYTRELLDDTFSKSTLCNSFSAIVAGIVAQMSAERFGYIAPFLIALNPLIIGMYLCLKTWENDSPEITQSKLSGSIKIDKNIWVLGLSQSLFLGAMYTFVFLWTPTLDISNKNVPYGLVFATFVVMISIGSGIFKVMSSRAEKLPFLIFSLSIFSTLVTITSIENEYVVFMSFLVFELACGIMFPTYGSLRSVYIPEDHRTTIMNIYRIPLNLFVVGVLLTKQYMTLKKSFSICLFAYVACISIWYAFTPNQRIHEGNKYDKTEETSDLDEYDLESEEEWEDMY